jgi:hypothetical protein
MNQQETLAGAVRSSRDLFLRFLAGFDESSRTRSAPSLPNHAAWTLGHCALTMHRGAERLDGAPLPETDFVTGDGTAGDAERFDTESVSFASAPADAPDRYPTLARSREIFVAACDRLERAARAASGETMQAEATWGSSTITNGDLVARLCFHNGTHAGQLVDLRRALGFDSVIG